MCTYAQTNIQRFVYMITLHTVGQAVAVDWFDIVGQPALENFT